jgi:hypothetical protein
VVAEHLSTQESFGLSGEEIADKLGNLRYDELAIVVGALAAKMLRDAHTDQQEGRRLLGGQLAVVSGKLKYVSDAITRVWQLCAPHM